MRWEKREAERKVCVGEDGKGFDQDVGDGFVTSEVGVKLVSGAVKNNFVS